MQPGRTYNLEKIKCPRHLRRNFQEQPTVLDDTGKKLLTKPKKCKRTPIRNERRPNKMSAVEKWWNKERAARTLYDHINLTAFPAISLATRTQKTIVKTTATTIATVQHIHDFSGLSLTASQYFPPLPPPPSSQQPQDLDINNWNLSDSIANTGVVNEFQTSDWAHPGYVVLLMVIYGIIVFSGIVGNASLVITLCSKPSGRLRNPLLVALCIADLLVAGISAPSTIATIAITEKSWNLPSIGCKVIHYLQSMPVAASTISFLMLSLDRYATVKHPSLAQLRQRRHLHSILAIVSWIGAATICIPILLAYRITTKTITRDSATSFAHHKTYTACYPDYGSSELQTSFIITHTILVFIFPGLGIVLNHLGVRRKLCALSLTARAAHGELPLPMPILRRPTHMIIVTGMANAARGVVSNDSSDEDEMVRNGDDKNFMMETIIRSSPKSPSPRHIVNMSRFQTYLYPYIFILSCALLSLVNCLQICDPVSIPKNETTVDYDPMDSNDGWNDDGFIYEYDDLPQPLKYGTFEFKTTYRSSQIKINFQILEYKNGTRKLALSGNYRVVIISNSFGAAGDGKLNIKDEFDIGLCTSVPSIIYGGIGQKTVATILG